MCDACKAVHEISAYVTISNIYKHSKNSPFQTHWLNELKMQEQDLLHTVCRWGGHWKAYANLVALALKLEKEEEEAVRDYPVAKGIKKHLQMYMVPALTHLLTDIFAVANCINSKEDINISSIQPVVNMTLASLEDLMNGPGGADTKFI